MPEKIIITDKAPYLVNVPVKINIWIRPECQRRQFEVIRKARPNIIFLQSDGGRNEEEWKAIHENRKMYDEEVDWNCTIYKFYEEQNNGLYTMGKKVGNFIWETVDRCIFTEDDLIPSVSFFKYCEVLLEKYKDDERIVTICGCNLLGKCENVTSSYFFSRQGSIWGTATWKRCSLQRQEVWEYKKDPYILDLLKQRTQKNKTFWRRVLGYKQNSIFEGHTAGGEFYTEFAMYGFNQLQIIPKMNLISNIGTTINSAHADSLDLLPMGIRKVFNLPVYEIDFPLEETPFVIPDIEYEKRRNRIMGYNHPILNAYRKIERTIYLLRACRMKSLLKKIQSKFGLNKAIEK